jgi:hypothetical protein
MIDLHMHIWGGFFPKRGPPNWSCTTVSREVCDFLAREENHVLNLVQYPYMGMDWRGSFNILFTIVKPPDERGNIIFVTSPSPTEGHYGVEYS